MNNKDSVRDDDIRASNASDINSASDINKIDAVNKIGMGKHVLAEFWHCQCAPALLTSTTPLLALLTDAVHSVGLTLVGQAVHDFNGAQDVNQNADIVIEQTNGVTLSLLLAESHLCIHTWGEYQTVTLDIYVCNVGNDNSEKAQALYAACLDLFQPKAHHVNIVTRQHQPMQNIVE